jgi:hexosaminidase
MQTIWPRAAAAAERQWSYDVTSKADGGVAYRMQAMRCWMLERGVASAPVTNADARSAPAGPGSCMTQ